MAARDRMLRAVVNALASEHESAVAGDRDPGDANVAANRATVLKGEDALYAADVALVEQLAHPDHGAKMPGQRGRRAAMSLDVVLVGL